TSSPRGTSDTNGWVVASTFRNGGVSFARGSPWRAPTAIEEDCRPLLPAEEYCQRVLNALPPAGEPPPDVWPVPAVADSQPSCRSADQGLHGTVRDYSAESSRTETPGNERAAGVSPCGPSAQASAVSR